MTILSQIEQPVWLPSLSLTGNQFLAEIARAQTDIETVACRSLAVEEYVHICCLVDCGTKAYLRMWPLIDIIKVEARRAAYSEDRWGRGSHACDWVELSTDEFRLGTQQEICLIDQPHYQELRVTYTAGWDFTVADPLPDPYFGSLDRHVQAIKSLASEIVDYRNNPQYCGIIQDNDVRFKQSSLNPGEIPAVMMDKAKKFRAYHQ